MRHAPAVAFEHAGTACPVLCLAYRLYITLTSYSVKRHAHLPHPPPGGFLHLPAAPPSFVTLAYRYPAVVPLPPPAALRADTCAMPPACRHRLRPAYLPRPRHHFLPSSPYHVLTLPLLWFASLSAGTASFLTPHRIRRHLTFEHAIGLTFLLRMRPLRRSTPYHNYCA